VQAGGAQPPKPPPVGIIGTPLPPLPWCPEGLKSSARNQASSRVEHPSEPMQCIARRSTLGVTVTGPPSAQVSELATRFRLTVKNLGMGTALRGYVLTVRLQPAKLLLTQIMGYDLAPGHLIRLLVLAHRRSSEAGGTRSASTRRSATLWLSGPSGH
jgi:hypothetical protein